MPHTPSCQDVSLNLQKLCLNFFHDFANTICKVARQISCHKRLEIGFEPSKEIAFV
jgi:hypothetical protein